MIEQTLVNAEYVINISRIAWWVVWVCDLLRLLLQGHSHLAIMNLVNVM